jgi:D-alanyl-D-alanine carboxypeptidase/D-alanyl-D-alanine-endopeptidase (penicillin-binding protein 4)
MKLFLQILFFYFSFSALYGQNAIQASINRLAADPALKHAGFGVCVVNLQNGQVVASHAPERSLVPASSLKLLAAATALSVLGPNYRYTTDLQIQGDVDEQGILHGNVIIKGSGDPSLASAEWTEAIAFDQFLEKFKLSIQQNGIRQIEGYIIGDDAHFSTAVTPQSWSFNDLGNYYAAGVHGLNIHDNLYYLQFKQSTGIGQSPAVYSVTPSIPDLQIVNEVRSAGKNTGDNAYIYGSPFTYLRYIRGSIPVGNGYFKIKGAIPDPALVAAQQLQAVLRQSGIQAGKGATTSRLMSIRQEKDERPAKTLVRQYSPRLSQIIERNLYRSVNLYSEALVHTLGKNKKNEGSTDKGLEVIAEFWSGQNIDMGAAFLDDGSGLSAKNAISAGLLARILRKMAQLPHFETFKNCIPLGGRSGSISRKFKGTAAEGKVWAKSGTLARVRTYAGYAHSNSGEKYSFAIFVNNYSGRGSLIRQKLDRFLVDLCRSQ